MYKSITHQANKLKLMLADLQFLCFLGLLLVLSGNLKAQVGTPTYLNVAGTTTANSFPFNSTTSNKIQWIYAPGAFTTAGGGAGSPAPSAHVITKVYIKFSSTINASSTYTNFEISLGQNVGAISTFPQAPSTTGVNFNTGLTSCFFQASGFQFTGITAGAWYGITLQNPFPYDPTLALVVEAKVSGGTGNSVNNITTTGLSQRHYAAYASATGTVNTGLTPFGMDMIPSAVCTAPPTPGTANSSVSVVCPGANFTLSLTGNSTGSGQTYQWEISPDNISWSPISGATSIGANVSQTASNYYRCAVTCSGQTTYSTPVLVNTNFTAMSGAYTINSAAATAGTNFQSFTDFANYINCSGVSGPVTVDVVSGSGPYNQSIILNQIVGTSALNTITINGNGNTLISATGNSTFEMNGTDNLIVNDLTIEATGTTQGLACHLWAGANDNAFNNCTFKSPLNVTATTTSPFSCSGSATAASAAGLSGNNNILTNCTASGGYYSIIFYGATGSIATGNQVINCTAQDFYSYGIYSLYQNGWTVRGCTVERPNSTTVTTAYGIYSSTGTVSSIIEKNRVRNLFGSLVGTSAAYAIYVGTDGVLGNEHKVINNVVSDIKTSGIIGGLYLASADFIQAYHNTISLDHTAATAGTTYGIYNTGTVGNIDIQNNNISITRGGTGVKYGLYFSTAVATTNYNNVYINSAAGTNNYGYWNGLAQLTQADFQVASGQEANSIMVLPNFANPGLNNFAPTNVAMDNLANPLAAVTDDILNNTRAATPDMGAYEFSVPTDDLTITAMVNPVVGNGCKSNAETVELTLQNLGLNPIDFASGPTTITINVGGPIPTTIFETLTSGVIPPGSSLNVVLSTPVDMSAPGTYTFDASCSYIFDANTSNDALPTQTRIIPALAAGTISIPNTTICTTTLPNFTLSGHTGVGNIQWQESSVSATGPWTNVGTNSTTYTPSANYTQNMWVQAEVSCNSNTLVSNTLAITVNNPQLTSTTGDTRCGIGPVTLQATSASGSINWYANPSGGTPLATGNSYSPTVSTTTTFYAAAGSGASGPFNLQSAPITTAGTTPIYHHMFMISSPTGLTLNDYAMKCGGTIGAMMDWNIYYRPDNYQLVSGANTSSTGWTLLASAVNIPSQGVGAFTTIFTGLGLTIPSGATYSFYIAPVNANAVHNYLTSTLGSTVASNTDMTIIGGNRGSALFNCSTSGGCPIMNLTYSLGCEGARQAVVATVTTPPTLTISGDATTCNNEVRQLDVTSLLPDYDTYTWTPTTNLYTDAACTVAYTGTSATTLYLKGAVGSTTTYTCNAINNSTSCANSATSIQTIMPAATLTASPTSLCVSGASSISISPSAPLGTGTIQWQESATGSGYTNIGGANAATYNTGTITSSNYYGVVFTDGTNTCSLNPTVQIVVDNPQVLSTTPGNDCGSGPVSITLGATVSSGANAVWYAAATGGAPLATGTSFTTPPISTTTTYYVASELGSGGNAKPILITEMDLGANDRFEIQNVSPYPVDVTGWRVAVSNNYTTFTSVNTNVQVLNGIMNPGDILSWTDATAGPNYWGSNILWNPGASPTYSAWAIIVDAAGNPVDFVATNWSSSVISANNLVIGPHTVSPGSIWSGNGIDQTTVAATNSISRVGVLDNNVASDFVIEPLTLGTNNANLTLPMNGFACASTRVPVVATHDGPCSTTLNITAFVQGYYLGSSSMNSVLFNQDGVSPLTDCDNITVELHSDLDYVPEYTTTAMLSTSGAATATFTSAVSGSYYVVLKHRNSLEVWSATAQSFPTTTSYNFSAAGACYADGFGGTPTVEVETNVWALWSGDIDQDGYIDVLDYNIWDPEYQAGFPHTNLNPDLDGNGYVELDDYNIWDPNYQAGDRYAQRP